MKDYERNLIYSKYRFILVLSKPSIDDNDNRSDDLR